jgi:hypothetical protein
MDEVHVLVHPGQVKDCGGIIATLLLWQMSQIVLRRAMPSWEVLLVAYESIVSSFFHFLCGVLHDLIVDFLGIFCPPFC